MNDIRNVFPELIDEITIIGDTTQVLNQKQFEYLSRNRIITEYGCDGATQFIRLQYLFTIEDIKKKIEEICRKVDE